MRSTSRGPDANRVPTSEHDPLPVAEQIPPVGVTMNHPGRKLKAESTVGVQKLRAPLPQPGLFLLIHSTARGDRPSDRDQRPVGGQHDRWQLKPVQFAKQTSQIGGHRLRPVLRQVPPERDHAPMASDRLLDWQRLNGGVIDGGGEQPDQPRTASIKPTPPRRMLQCGFGRRRES